MTAAKSFRALGPVAGLAAALLLTGLPSLVRAQTPAAAEPPSSWIEPETGHRVIRLTREPDSVSFYFNDNGYTPDGKMMVFTTPAGISVLDLATHESHLVVAGPARTVIVGRKTPTIFYMKSGKEPLFSTLWGTNVETGETHEIGTLPRRANVFTINADETLGCGVYLEGDPENGGNFSRAPRKQLGPTLSQNGLQAADKEEMMARRLAARLPMSLYTINLQTGKTRVLIEHSTDWLGHVQFSPTDPTLLIYCHEGLWQLVDRIWTIRTDGTQNQLIHQRTMENETDGHEWWSADGKNIWYQLHYPGAMKTSFLASYNVETGQRTWYHYGPEAVSIHHMTSPDGKIFCGDGNTPNPWMMIVRPVPIADNHTVGAHLIKTGTTRVERLVNMSKHNYALEPNGTFSPDQKFVIFASNMFGPTYVFAVEVAKADTARP